MTPEPIAAPTPLGNCEQCGEQIVAGVYVAALEDGHYSHYDCINWEEP